MNLTLLELFDGLFKNKKFDAKLAKEVYRFHIAFISKTDDHAAFFGGNLTGVHVLRFTEREFNWFFNMLADIDPNAVKDKLRNVPDINLDWEITSDVFNLTVM